MASSNSTRHTHQNSVQPEQQPASSSHNIAAASSGMEVLKSFKLNPDDPCYKVIQVALKRYKLPPDADWRDYALSIVSDNEERCLSLDEKPLLLFQQYQRESM